MILSGFPEFFPWGRIAESKKITLQKVLWYLLEMENILIFTWILYEYESTQKNKTNFQRIFSYHYPNLEYSYIGNFKVTVLI